MKVVILCGGKGTRLGLTDRPKVMVPVMGKPLLERLVEVGKASGFDQYVFLSGYLAEIIETHFGDGSRHGIRIEHVRETEPLGTAGAVRAARHLLDEPFLVVYGDLLIDVDLAHFAKAHRRSGATATLFVHPNDHMHDSDLVEADDNGRITRFLSKPHAENAILRNLVSGAIYVLNPQTIDFVPSSGPSDWGRDVFPVAVAAGAKFHAYRSLEYAKDVGTPRRLTQGVADLKSGRVAARSRRHAKPAIFLDRDGVLNRELGGVHRPAQMELLPGVGSAVRAINQAGISAICVTNQPDIAKGLMSPADLQSIFAALDTALAHDHAYLDAAYFCPHHPERGWPGEVPELKVECDCRKPKPGMLLAAARDHNLDLTRSWMVGDRYADVIAGHRAGTKAILVETGHGGSDRDRYRGFPEHSVPNLSDAVHLIISELVGEP